MNEINGFLVFRILLFIVWVISMFYLVRLSLMSPEGIPDPFPHVDKVYHFIYYFWLALLLGIALGPGWKLPAGALFIFLVGVGLEFLQEGLAYRTFSYGDIVANLAGVAAGSRTSLLLFGRLLLKLQ